MWRVVVKIILSIVLWSALGALVLYGLSLAGRQRAAQRVESVDISISDSTATHRLISSQRVEAWLNQSHIATIGQAIDSVNITGIQQSIMRHHCIDRADVYITQSGEMHIDITQREGVVRLRTDGYNAYLTRDGYIFAAPAVSALYVPVITGSFRPITPPNYEGLISEYAAQRIKEYRARIAEIGKQFVTLKHERDTYRAMRKAPQRRKGESRREFRQRREKWQYEWKHNKQGVIRYSVGMERDVELRRRKVERSQDAVRAEQKKFEQRYADFRKLINFVEWIGQDPFWRAEVVQIVANTSPSGGIDVELVPRSGNFRILIGGLDDVETKIEKLQKFYDKGLARLGWERFKIVDVKYKNQVVCTE